MIKMRPSKDRVIKAAKPAKRSFTDSVKQKLLDKLNSTRVNSPKSPSELVSVFVGPYRILFSAHEDMLCQSPVLLAACNDAIVVHGRKCIILADEEPDSFSCVLQYLYRGSYHTHVKRHDAMPGHNLTRERVSCHDGERKAVEQTVYHVRARGMILRDTAVYCLADKLGLEELKRLALRKHELDTGNNVATLLRSARFAYDNTSQSDSRLRAHYLALIISHRKIFKRSGTLQMEMEMAGGGRLFFDLFVTMCNHMDDIMEIRHVHPTQNSYPLSTGIEFQSVHS